MGTALDGFPNLFMVMGPNTFAGHTSVMLSIENCVEYILRVVRPVLAGEAECVEPTRQASEQWVMGLKRDINNTVFAGCSSWYNGYGGWNPVVYPRSHLDYYLRCLFPNHSHWDTTMTTSGQQQPKIRKAIGYIMLGVFATAFAVYFYASAKGAQPSMIGIAAGVASHGLDGIMHLAQETRDWINVYKA